MWRYTQFQQLLTWITSHKKYTFTVQHYSAPPPPPSDRWTVRVLPPHTFDTWARTQLENRGEESASSPCWLARCTPSTAATPVLVLLPVSRSLMCDRLYLASLRLFTLCWTGVTWEWDSFWCILKLTNMCSPRHQYYLPAPGLVLPCMLLEKAPVKVASISLAECERTQRGAVKIEEAPFFFVKPSF